jgi:hypothetical protein
MKHVDVTVGLIDGGTGIGVNVPHLNLSRPSYVQWLTELLSVMGFQQTKAVQFKKNDPCGKVDWRRLRIPADECEMQEVDPERAVEYVVDWFDDRQMWREYGTHFRLGTAGYEQDCWPDCEPAEVRHQSLRTTRC